MKQQNKKLLSIGILIILVVLFGYYIYKNIHEFRALQVTNPWFIAVLCFTVLVNAALIGLQIDGFVSAFGVRLNIKEWFGLSIINSFYNMITPFRGGVAVRAVYLKKNHKLSYTNFLSAFAGAYVITFLIASFLGLVSIYLLYFKYGILNWIVNLLFFLSFLSLLIVVIFSPSFPKAKNKWINRFVNVLNGWNTIRRNRKILLIVFAVTISQILLGVLGGIVSYHIFGISLGFSKALFLSCLGTLSLLISVTPSGLGIQEAVSVFSALVIGITPAQSLSVAILGRIVQIVVMFILGPIFSYKLLKTIPK